MLNNREMFEYSKLVKSKLTPPNYVFSIVWPVLYLSIGISLCLYFLNTHTNYGLILFSVQMILNFLWYPVFFKYGKIKLAFGIIILLCVFVLLTIIEFYKTNKISGLILVPYFIWILFATYLNFYVVMHNFN